MKTKRVKQLEALRRIKQALYQWQNIANGGGNGLVKLSNKDLTKSKNGESLAQLFDRKIRHCENQINILSKKLSTIEYR